MKEITLGKTGIKTPQNAFGALPIQRVTMDEAVKILQRAYEGGMTFFDTARAYSDSEEKLGQAFEGMRDKIFIASSSGTRPPRPWSGSLAASRRRIWPRTSRRWAAGRPPSTWWPGSPSPAPRSR